MNYSGMLGSSVVMMDLTLPKQPATDLSTSFDVFSCKTMTPSGCVFKGNMGVRDEC